jgi:DNA-binding SARP family transcriptional activator
MNDTELKALSAQVKKLTARVEALERLLQRIIQQKPVSERQLERALRSMRRSENASVR